jgi:SOS-response transcriptional repressor LexA
MPTTLTPRQRQIYDYIKQRIDGGFPPTIREICNHIGVKGLFGVVTHLRALRKKGYIAIDENISRGIRLVNQLKPGELRDLEGNVHSFANFLEAGNYTREVDGAYFVFNKGELVGAIRFVGNPSLNGE